MAKIRQTERRVGIECYVKPNYPGAASLATTIECPAERQWREVAGRER